jgi:lysophospholipid acyltransferase (LPLAT)-like uncharacterized protein
MFKKNILPVIARFVMRLFSSTFRWFVYNENIVKEIKETGKNIIFCFWHGKQFVLVYSHRNRNVYIMTSLSSDGDLQSKILQGFGYQVVRGSSSKGGAKALVEMIRQIENGYDVAFAVDGPRGPIYKAKPGPIFLASKTNRVIIPVASSAKDFWILKKAWDQYLIPKPFTKVAVMYGKPIEVSKNDNIDEKMIELENALNSLTKELDKRIQNSKF